MTTDSIPALLEQIDELLAEPRSTAEPAGVARLERMLTDGYAYALVLESERWRIEQRMSELTDELGEGDREKAQELALLSRRLSNNDTVLEGLRSTLSRLRARTTAVRASA